MNVKSSVWTMLNARKASLSLTTHEILIYLWKSVEFMSISLRQAKFTSDAP